MFYYTFTTFDCNFIPRNAEICKVSSETKNVGKAHKYRLNRHLPTYEKIIKNLYSFSSKKLPLLTKVTAFFATIIFYSISLTIFLTGRTKVGDTDSSSSPISTNLSVSVVSAPSSPQIPAQIPSLCALSTTIWIIRRTAS